MKVKKMNLSDEAVVLWNYYNPSMPFFVGTIGSSDCASTGDAGYFTQRKNRIYQERQRNSGDKRHENQS